MLNRGLLNRKSQTPLLTNFFDSKSISMRKEGRSRFAIIYSHRTFFFFFKVRLENADVNICQKSKSTSDNSNYRKKLLTFE